ncbi:MAG: TIGR04552 family protein [Bdellovibrionales bacterium]
MKLNLEFDPEVFWSIIGARPVVETTRLNVRSREEACAYLKTYGYDLDMDADREKLWQIHARALIYIRTQLLQEGEAIPEDLSDPKLLGDIAHLLMLASEPEPEPEPERERESDRNGSGSIKGGASGAISLSRWACALLRVMHVISQLQNDLFNHFSLEIQEEIFRSYRQFVQNDSIVGIRLFNGVDADSIPLQKFEIKPFKDSDSAITKLLAKPDEVAFGLLDKIGVRFVTNSLFDVFRVMRFLVVNHVVSPANVIPNQSNNTLYPVNLFMDVMGSLPRQAELDVAKLDALLHERLRRESAHARFLEKPNQFTSREYKFVKFITRQLVRVTLAETQKSFTFFYPYEVQILDYEHYLKTLAGPASHEEYKARQRASARKRVLVQEPIG